MCQTLDKLTRFNILFMMMFISSLWAQDIFALKADMMQKLVITADSTVYNNKTGITVFEGHVKVNQGSTRINANRLVTKSNARHKMIEATAYGILQPAQFITLEKPGEAELQAEAMIIKFYPGKFDVVLEQRATVSQGNNRFQREHILYNRENSMVIVPESGGGKTVIIYDPDKTNHL